MITIVLRCGGTITTLHFLRHEVKVVHVFREGAVASRHDKDLQLRVSPGTKTFQWFILTFFNCVLVHNWLHKRNFNAIILLVYPRAIAAQKYSMVDTHVDFV